MIVQGTVQRLVMNEGSPYMEFRTRDLGAMFVETEWGWSRSLDDAYIFLLILDRVFQNTWVSPYLATAVPNWLRKLLWGQK